jgi:hypothetical protein
VTNKYLTSAHKWFLLKPPELIVADETLNVNEWYLVTSIGSDPA